MSFKAATYVGARQRTWLEAIQERINFTAHILGSIKAVKMLGLGERFETSIQRMRIRELALSKKFRRLSSFNVCLGGARIPLSPFTSNCPWRCVTFGADKPNT